METTARPTIKQVKKCFDDGLTLMTIKDMFSALPIFGSSLVYGGQDLNYPEYCDDYFAAEQEGKNFYTLKNMDKFRLPTVGIILKDGTIYKVERMHMEVACWLKYNNVDLKNSLRYVYFQDTKRLDIREGYDHVRATNENNPDILCSVWNELHDDNEYEYDLEPTEEQIQAIYYLSRRFNVKFEKIFEDNVGFRMNPYPQTPYTKEQKRLGAYNDDAITHALNKLQQKQKSPIFMV